MRKYRYNLCSGTDRFTTRGGVLFGNSIEAETLNDQL